MKRMMKMTKMGWVLLRRRKKMTILLCVSQLKWKTSQTKLKILPFFAEAKALAEKQMNELKGQIEGKCVVQ